MSISQSSLLNNGSVFNYTAAPSPIPDGLTWETATTYDLGEMCIRDRSETISSEAADSEPVRSDPEITGSSTEKRPSDCVTVTATSPPADFR